MTKFTLCKANLSCHTTSLEAVMKLKALGWEIQLSSLGELI